jgi:hypothetical protein
VANFKVTSQRLPERAKENLYNPYTGQLVSTFNTACLVAKIEIKLEGSLWPSCNSRTIADQAHTPVKETGQLSRLRDRHRRKGQELFPFTASRSAVGSPNLCNEYQTSFPAPRTRRETKHSPPSSADSKNAWSYTSTPPFTFTAWCLIKHRKKLYLNYTLHI